LPATTFLPLARTAEAGGLAVIVDVLRAFTTAAFAFAAGAKEIVLVETVEQALSLRDRLPGALAMGEVDGERPEGFDLSNSPEEIEHHDLAGVTIVHRTTAGTLGAVRAAAADALAGAAFVTAAATARHIRASRADAITFVVTGEHGELDGDDDLACAQYIAALVEGAVPDPAPFLERTRRSTAGRRFLPGHLPQYRPGDLERALDVDRFGFAMPIERRDDLLVMRPDPPP
jgi:2-phosphosulfolactate phosphatase